MAPSTEIAGYEIMGTLGYGARSTIFAVKDRKNQVFALKRVIRSSPEDQRFVDQAEHEHNVAQQFNHPSLRKSYKIIRSRNMLGMRTNEVMVLMEFIDGVTLEQMPPQTLQELVRIFQDTAIALGVMARSGYVHADIKPNNILLTNRDMVKVIDFGQSCPIGTVKERIQGTPDYIAPEQVRRKPITPQTDIFNLGATMYWALTGDHVPTMIPKGLQKRDGGKHVISRPSDLPKFPSPREQNSAVPPALSSLVMNCLENDPRERPQSMTQLYERMELAINQFMHESKFARRRFKPGQIESLHQSSMVEVNSGSSVFGVNDSDAGQSKGIYDSGVFRPEDIIDHDRRKKDDDK